MEDCRTFKDSQFHSFLFSDVLVCTLFKKVQTRSINYKIILFPELNLFKSWFLTSANNIKKELVVIFAQNRFSQFYWLLLIAAFLPVGTVPPFKQTVLALMWKFLCTQLLLTRHNKYPSHWYFDHYGKFYKSYLTLTFRATKHNFSTVSFFHD